MKISMILAFMAFLVAQGVLFYFTPRPAQAPENSGTINQFIGLTMDLPPDGYTIGIDGSFIPEEKA